MSDPQPDGHVVESHDARALHIDRAQGMLVGDNGIQNNYFHVHSHAGDADGGGSRGISDELQPVMADLPDESAVFAGRDTDLATLLKILGPTTSGMPRRVAVISGMAGVGKTELAVHTAHAAVRNGWFPGGVLFVTLHGEDLKVAEIALDGFLNAVGIPGDLVPADPQARSRLFSSRIAQYAEAGKPVLVVIDNAVSVGQCELLIPARGRALVTSRNTLATLNARLVRLKVLGAEDGVTLLAGRLVESLGQDTRVTAHRDDACTVSKLCGGLPLALRIVAAILAENPARSLAKVAADLLDARTRLDELSWEDGDDMRGVRAAFDVSYHGLKPERARVFHLLPVNPGPEISTSAAAVLADLSQPDVRRHLEGLARTHLIEPGGSDGRWRMHDLIRIYAAEEQPDGMKDALARLLLYYMNTAITATQHLQPAMHRPTNPTFAGRLDALAWLDSEFPNLVAIALLPGLTSADFALRLWRYFELRRRTNDGIMLTGHALLIARQHGDSGVEARAQSNLAGLFRQARMFDAAISAGQMAVAANRSMGDLEGMGIALNNLAAAQVSAERFEDAIPTGREAVAVFQSLGDPHREGIALGHIAVALRATGQLAECIAAYHNMLALMRDAGDQRGEATGLLNLGHALQDDGRLDEAIATEEQAAAIFAALGDRTGEGSALNNLGGFLRLKAQHHEAISVLRTAVDVLTDTGDIHRRASAMVSLGQALAAAGLYEEAITVYTDAIADCQRARDRRLEAVAERNRGQALEDAGRSDQAADAFRAAVEIFREVGDRREEGMSLILLGNVLVSAQPEEAIAVLKAGAAICTQLGDPELERIARGLLDLTRPLPTAAELRRRIETGSLEQVIPGLWIDVQVVGGKGNDDRQRIADQVRATLRNAVADTARQDAHDGQDPAASSRTPSPDHSRTPRSEGRPKRAKGKRRRHGKSG